MIKKKIVIVGSIVSGFGVLVLAVFILVRSRIISPEMGFLMLIALLGLYVGFGILIAAYRLISKLD